MKFTCPTCGARNSNDYYCGCDPCEEVDEQADPEADRADHWVRQQQER